MLGQAAMFSTSPAPALFVENCLGVETHLYTLNFFSSDQHSTRFPSENLELGARTRMRHRQHWLKADSFSGSCRPRESPKGP